MKNQCFHNVLVDNSLTIRAFEKNMTVISGQKATLLCSFSDSESDFSLSSTYQLIWIRLSSPAHPADSILAHNQDLLIVDSRLNIQRSDMDYSLTLNDVQVDDEGIYACEMNTQPPTRDFIYLSVHGKKNVLLSFRSRPFDKFVACSMRQDENMHERRLNRHLLSISSRMTINFPGGNQFSGKMCACAYRCV